MLKDKLKHSLSTILNLSLGVGFFRLSSDFKEFIRRDLLCDTNNRSNYEQGTYFVTLTSALAMTNGTLSLTSGMLTFIISLLKIALATLFTKIIDRTYTGVCIYTAVYFETLFRFQNTLSLTVKCPLIKQ